jgi:hypothetical protein
MPGHPTCTGTATAAAAVGRRTNVNPVARASAPGSPDRTTADNGNLRMATRDAGADTTGWTAVAGTSRAKAAPGPPAYGGGGRARTAGGGGKGTRTGASSAFMGTTWGPNSGSVAGGACTGQRLPK